MEAINNIENRPKELYQLPFYKDLPLRPIKFDKPPVSGDLLELDLLTLSGIQPLENEHVVINAGVLTQTPSQDSIEIYRKQNTRFQLVQIVLNCHHFIESNGYLTGKPYNISLQPASKRGQIESVDINFIEKINIRELEKTNPIYKGFNPFNGAYGLYLQNFADFSNIESDMVGFVIGQYFLATKFNHHEVLAPHFSENQQINRDYKKFRKKRYFKPFQKTKPRRIWGCDSPIELFLAQALASQGHSPELQTIICKDGFTVPHLHTLWENNRSRRQVEVITEADFFFPTQKLAIFCDSVAHHSSAQAIQKDKAIDDKLRALGIQSLRLSGTEIVRSPFTCLNKIENVLEQI